MPKTGAVADVAICPIFVEGIQILQKPDFSKIGTTDRDFRATLFRGKSEGPDFSDIWARDPFQAPKNETLSI